VSSGAGFAVVCCVAGSVPAEALPLVRAADAVYETPELGLGFPLAREPGDLPAAGSVVLCAADPESRVARALLDAGARLVPAPVGACLLDAVAVMDRLRSPGGCPWDAAQTHESLRHYLLEETYELLEAVEESDRTAMREELGDVLLQVIFHARLSAEDETDPFGIDEVADGLVCKLVGRHPHVFGGGEHVPDAAAQERRWDELKRLEKRRTSSLDGVAMGQPALGLTAKLVSRAARAGLPSDLLAGEPLVSRAAELELSGIDPELRLRAAARELAAAVRAAESAAREHGLDPLAMSADDWRRCWPE
jgi:XTP/dITP diphosphohydrolase